MVGVAIPVASCWVLPGEVFIALPGKQHNTLIWGRGAPLQGPGSHLGSLLLGTLGGRKGDGNKARSPALWQGQKLVQHHTWKEQEEVWMLPHPHL